MDTTLTHVREAAVALRLALLHFEQALLAWNTSEEAPVAQEEKSCLGKGANPSPYPCENGHLMEDLRKSLKKPLGPKALYALWRNGYHTLDDIRRTPDEILGVHRNVGKAIVRQIRAALPED